MAGKAHLTKVDRWVIGIAAFVTVALWSALAYLPRFALDSNRFKVDPEEVKRVQSVLQQLGTYGDMFGALNCIFSGAAFVGVVYAVVLQRRELQHQKDASARTERSSEIQNRITACQNLADFHRRQALLHEGGRSARPPPIGSGDEPDTEEGDLPHPQLAGV
jgi:hypothetical protein